MATSSRIRRSATLAGAVLGGLLAILVTPSSAQWKVHVAGRSEPVDADFYGEETPWVFFRFKEDRSMYLFTLGCDRVLRVERDGVELPRVDCPLPRLATTMPRIYSDIMDREAKLLEEAIARYSREVDQLQKISSGAAGPAPAPGKVSNLEEQSLQLAQLARSTMVLSRQADRTAGDIESIDRRIDALVLAAKAYPPPEKPRYFFFRR